MKHRNPTPALAAVLALGLLLAAVSVAGTAAAHACSEATQGEPTYDCGSCEEGQYHHHRFSDGTSCSTQDPCTGIGCNTIEGFCKDFPKLCPKKEGISVLP